MDQQEYIKTQTDIILKRGNARYLRALLEDITHRIRIVSRSIDIFLEVVDFDINVDTPQRRAYRYMVEQFERLNNIKKIAEAYAKNY